MCLSIEMNIGTLFIYYIEVQPITFIFNDGAFYHQTKKLIDFWCKNISYSIIP